MANEEVLGPRKTMFVLVIVVGCFAVLWPRILSPLIMGPSREQLKPNQFDRDAALKQERPSVLGAAPHPALRERGRAIPPGVPAPPARGPVAMPPHVRPPPIPGMRPPLGSPGGPVPAPKSSMGFVMPIYTICIIVFFVYTLSKILFKRTGTSPYETLTPDPQFRRRVFRDDSRSSPDKLGPKERDTIVTAISGLVAEVQQQMEASYAQNQQGQDVQQDNHTRPYTNGTILHNSGPVHIVTSEYQEPKDKITEQKEKDASPEITSEVKEIDEKEAESHDAELKPEQKESTRELPVPDTESGPKSSTYPEESNLGSEEVDPTEEAKPNAVEVIARDKDELEQETGIENKIADDGKEIEKEVDEENTGIKHKIIEDEKEIEKGVVEEEIDEEEIEEEEIQEEDHDLGKSKSVKPTEAENSSEKLEVVDATDKQIAATGIDVKLENNGDIRKTEEFLHDETKALVAEKSDKQSTPELLEDAIKDEDDGDQEKSSVKVIGMEITAHSADGGACGAPAPAASIPRPLVASASSPRAHEAESVQSIYLETEIPQQSRVLVADFAEDRPEQPPPTKHSPMVVSGKMTLSLIPDAPRETPERDQESTIDEFTTASAVTQNAAEKQGEESDEEIEEEIEIEEIEEEEEEEVPKQKEQNKAQ